MTPVEIAITIASFGVFAYGVATAAFFAYRQRTKHWVEAYERRTAMLGDVLGRIASSATSVAYQRHPMPVAEDCSDGCLLRRAKAQVTPSDVGSGGGFR